MRRFTTLCVFLFVTRRVSACMNARDAISGGIVGTLFERASASVSAYSWTLAERCARRFCSAPRHCRALASSPAATMSHTCMFSCQFSLVSRSSVARATISSNGFGARNMDATIYSLVRLRRVLV